MANTGTLELRSGHLKAAEVFVEEFLRAGTIARRRLPAAVAAAMSYYGNLLSITNRNEPAISVLLDATALGERYAGAGSPLAIQNRLFLGEAQLAIGDQQKAAVTLTKARDEALAESGAAHPLTLRSQLALSQLAAAAGNDEGAQAQLRATVEGMRKLGAQGESNLAQALEVLGEGQSRLGRLNEASATLNEAVAIREKSPGDL